MRALPNARDNGRRKEARDVYDSRTSTRKPSRPTAPTPVWHADRVRPVDPTAPEVGGKPLQFPPASWVGEAGLFWMRGHCPRSESGYPDCRRGTCIVSGHIGGKVSVSGHASLEGSSEIIYLKYENECCMSYSRSYTLQSSETDFPWNGALHGFAPAANDRPCRIPGAL